MLNFKMLSVFPVLLDFIYRLQDESEQLIDYKLLFISVVLSIVGSLSRYYDQSSVESISKRESVAIIVSGLVMGLIAFLLAGVLETKYAITGLISIGLAHFGLDIVRTVRLGIPNLIKALMNKVPDIVDVLVKRKIDKKEE